MTNQEWLEVATQRLIENDLPRALPRAEAHLHARLLLDGVTEMRFSHLIAPKSVLEPGQEEKLQRWFADAMRGRPIPYILEKAPFYGRDWRVDERVLIPRPETELLIETALQLLPSEAKIADLGTGSGIIAVTLKKMRPDISVWALDISPGALEIAGHNAAEHGAHVDFVRGDGAWIAPLQPFSPLDALISNPPYIAPPDIEALEIGVRDFEPRLALDGGSDGLDPYRAIARDAKNVLKNDGFVALEFGMGQFAAIRAIFQAQDWQVEAARRDLAGIERVFVARPTVSPLVSRA